jgi:2-keto-4-pentenoate hydratase/2-oxohepta-3-ene-1,7-dioic acid hydratase in catechol pathway
VNYLDHREETGHVEKPRHPTIFSRFADTQVGHERPVAHPPNTTQLDYEGEVAIVIGRHVSAIETDADARTAIVGLSCYNDLSVRDWQLHNSQWLPGKNFTGVGSFGPWLVTMDEFDDLGSVRLTTRVNGEVRQDATLDDLVFDFPAILRYLTGFTRLAPGDVIVTGTPGGVGLAAKPPRFLVPGDVTEIEVSGVGVLRNEIVAPPESPK